MSASRLTNRRRHPVARFTPALALAGLGACSGAPAERIALATTIGDCRVDGVDEPARCVRLHVPEDPSDPAGRTIEIHAAVLPARGPQRREPLLVLQGGPGFPGTRLARTFSTREALREHHDLVFVDQRGVGGSSPLTCAYLGRIDFLGALLPADHLTTCREHLAATANLALYTTEASAHDLEALRRALEIDRWSIYGISYGSRLAQALARAHPERVHRVVLDGVVPFDVGLTADLAESMQRSITYVAERCEKDASCRARYPDVGQALERLAARVEASPASVAVTDSTGATLQGRFSRWELAYAVRGMLYGPLAASLPAMVHEALVTGDLNPFARIYLLRSRWVGDSTGQALHMGVYCSEDLPFIDSLDVRSVTQATFMGDRYYRAYRDGCTSWPMPPVDARFREPWRSDIETLLFSGERDPVTPPAYALRVAGQLGRSLHVQFPGGGHAEQTPCKTALMAAFLATGRIPPEVVSCLETLDFPPFRPAEGR
jgi:pimeloyl-ACP methyl ester carboxylesterase